MKKVLLTLLFAMISTLVWTQTKVKGKVTDNNEPVQYATVKVMEKFGNDFKVRAGDNTDENGEYEILGLSAGRYYIMVNNVTDTLYKGQFALSENEYKVINIKISVQIDEVVITDNSFKIDETMVSTSFDYSTIRQTGLRGANSFAGMTPGLSITPTGEISFRGGRPSGNIWFVDGVKVRGTFSEAVPLASVKNIEFISGGFPAEYGDFTGGIGIVTTKSYLFPVIPEEGEKLIYKEICNVFETEEVTVFHFNGRHYPLNRSFRKYLKNKFGVNYIPNVTNYIPAI